MATYLEYINAAMHKAEYERMEDGRWFATIPGFDGLWAVGASIEEARNQLYETLDGWMYVHLAVGENKAPEIDGVDLESLPEKVA